MTAPVTGGYGGWAYYRVDGTFRYLRSRSSSAVRLGAHTSCNLGEPWRRAVKPVPRPGTTRRIDHSGHRVRVAASSAAGVVLNESP